MFYNTYENYINAIDIAMKQRSDSSFLCSYDKKRANLPVHPL
ncbi:hypothetical protein HORM4_520074 [Vibrio harveyi]|nr:hypothetical protein HORM4_520074 [Vibrio harveyi]